MKSEIITQKWYSWIPTNLGYLNYNYIADLNILKSVFGGNNVLKDKNQSNIKIELENTHLSDINEIASSLLKYDEVLPKAILNFNKRLKFNTTTRKNQPIGIFGDIIIEYDELLSISSDFDIRTNGLIEILNININYNESEINELELTYILESTIANAIYTLIKKVVHGDKHHHQKIDTIIGVYTRFDPKQILTDLGFQIKRLEKYIKNKDNVSSLAIFNNVIEEAHNTAVGFMSYIRTFHGLFINGVQEEKRKHNNKNHYISLEGIENVVSSIKSIVDRNSNEIAHSNKKMLFTVTLIALFASLNIFYSTLLTDNPSYVAMSIDTFFKTLLDEYHWLNFLSSRDIAISIMLLLSLLLFLYFKKSIGYYGTKWLGSKIKYSLYEVYILTRYLNSDEDLKKEYKNDVQIIKRYRAFIQAVVLAIPLSLLGMIIGVLANYYLAVFMFLVLCLISIFLFFIKIVK